MKNRLVLLVVSLLLSSQAQAFDFGVSQKIGPKDAYSPTAIEWLYTVCNAKYRTDEGHTKIACNVTKDMNIEVHISTFDKKYWNADAKEGDRIVAELLTYTAAHHISIGILWTQELGKVEYIN